MNDLFKFMIDKQGGLKRWKTFHTATAHMHVGGNLWKRKGHEGIIEEVDVVINLLEQKLSHIPNDEWHTSYSPQRVAIETANGNLFEELYNPRASFKGHVWDTIWSNLQLAYFTGYATWNYFNTPFLFATPGFEVTEIEPWEENNETWRRLKVKWPENIHTHTAEQVLYVDVEGFIRRLDYKVEIAGNNAAVHYLSNYKDIAGIKMATKRMVYPMGENNKPQPDAPVIVSIDWSDIKFS